MSKIWMLSMCFQLCFAIAQGQKFYTMLYGFKLGQYREATRNEFGKPCLSGVYGDGVQYDKFMLKPDSSLYMVFEYTPQDTEVIWSIQVSGTDSRADIGFENLKLGSGKSEMVKLLGKSSSQEDIGRNGSKWVYDKCNFSFEVNAKGKLSSIKIFNESSELFRSSADIPSFEKVMMALCSDDNETIANMLSGDMELYRGDSTYYFQKSFRTEWLTDFSKMFSIIKSASKDLKSVDIKNPAEYEEKARYGGGEVMHVKWIKKDHSIMYIMMKYFGGEYRIFEIRCQS